MKYSSLNYHVFLLLPMTGGGVGTASWGPVSGGKLRGWAGVKRGQVKRNQVRQSQVRQGRAAVVRRPAARPAKCSVAQGRCSPRPQNTGNATYVPAGPGQGLTPSSLHTYMMCTHGCIWCTHTYTQTHTHTNTLSRSLSPRV